MEETKKKKKVYCVGTRTRTWALFLSLEIEMTTADSIALRSIFLSLQVKGTALPLSYADGKMGSNLLYIAFSLMLTGG